MKLPNITGLVKVGKTFVMANRPELLFGASIAATLGSAVLAAKGGYDARGLVEDAEEDYGRPLEVKEKIQLTWPCYVPAAIGTIGAIGSTTGLHIVHIKEKKALAAAALAAIDEVKIEAKKYADNLLEVSNENMTDEQKEKAQEELNARGPAPLWFRGTDAELEDLYLVRDVRTGRDIWSTQLRIEEAMLVIHKAIVREGDCDLSLFYSHAGFADVPEAQNVGWSGQAPELEWGTSTRDDGRAVRTFTFRPAPTIGYDRQVG